jgi:hypothetical protein
MTTKPRGNRGLSLLSPAVRAGRTADRDDRRRAQGRARVRLHRQRLSHGTAIALVAYDGAVVNLLVRAGWICDSAACDRKAVGSAISALIRDIAEHS